MELSCDEGHSVSYFLIFTYLALKVGNKNTSASDCNKSKVKCYDDPPDGYSNGSNKSASWGKIH